MTYKLTATVTHKSFDEPIVHELYFHGETKDDILDQLDTLHNHKHNLKHYGKTSFKDTRGVKHSWRLELMEHLN